MHLGGGGGGVRLLIILRLFCVYGLQKNLDYSARTTNILYPTICEDTKLNIFFVSLPLGFLNKM